MCKQAVSSFFNITRNQQLTSFSFRFSAGRKFPLQFGLLILCLVSCIGTAVAASISGIVQDPQGQPVAGTVITLTSRDGDQRRRTESDASGHYELAELPSGAYLLEAQAKGFAMDRVRQIDLENSGAALRTDISLKLAGVQQQVTVTAAGTPQSFDELSKSVSVLNRSTMDERDENSISEALRPLPGIRVEQQGGPGSFSAIRIRGLRNQDTAVLVDGMRLRDPAATQGDASGLIEDLLVTDISRAEVLRGSGSSLYGTNAIGGVINLITDEGGGDTHGSLLVEGGSLGTFRGRGLLSGGLAHGRIDYSLGATHLNISNGVDGNDPDRDTSGQGRIVFHLTPSTELIAHAFGGTSFIGINNSPLQLDGVATSGVAPAIPLSSAALRLYTAGVPLTAAELGNATFIPSVDDPDSSRTGHFFLGGLSLLGHPTTQFGYSIRYQAVTTDRTYGNGPGGVDYQPLGNTSTDYWGTIHTLNAQANYQAGPFNLLSAGYEWEDEAYSNHSLAAIDPLSNSATAVSQKSNTAYAQDQIRLLGDRLQISGAFRAQVFNLDQPSFTPIGLTPYADRRFATPPTAYTGDGSIAYYIRRTGTKFRSHIGRGYRVPSLYERFATGYDQQFGYSAYGDPRLSPEHSISVDGGIDQAFLNGRLRTSATYFYTHLQNTIIFDFSGLIDSTTDPFGRFGGYLNSRGGIARGVEAIGDYRVSNSLSVSANYTYTDAREQAPIVPDVWRSFITPEHQFSSYVLQRLGQRLFLQFTLTAASNYLGQVFGAISSGAYQFPGLKKGDIGASYRIPLDETRGLRLFGNVDNVFDQDYYEGGFRTPGVTARGGIEFQF